MRDAVHRKAHTPTAITVTGDGRRKATTLPDGVAMNYSYDAASQLTGISYTQGGTTLGDLTYAYDAAGRRTVVGGSFARTGVPQAAAGASYNANNQLTSWKGCGADVRLEWESDE